MMALYAHLWNYRAESTDCEIYVEALHIELFSTNLNCIIVVEWVDIIECKLNDTIRKCPFPMFQN